MTKPARIASRAAHLVLGAALCVTPTLQGGNIALPDIGASAGALITPAEEERLGRQFMRSVRRSLSVIDDPLLVEYAEGLGNRLATHADNGGRSFHFFLIDQPVINAFAGPGGHIGIYSGLILSTESESELESVVAHEIAHVTQAHLVRAFENASQMSGPMAALLLAAVLLGSSVSSDVGIAAAAGIQAAAMQRQLNFTRENEKEADRVGIGILAESGFDPHAMPVFFQRLAKSSRLYENNAPEFLRTHPVTTNRIADALGRANEFPYRQQPENPDYHLVRVTLRERGFANPDDAVTHFENTLNDGRYRRKEAEQYGYALALLRARKPDRTLEVIEPLLRDSPTNIAYTLLRARAELALGRTDPAFRTLENALELFPGNYPLTHAYAELALEHQRTEQAIPMLDEALLRRPHTPALHELRSRAAARLGRETDAHIHLAEAHHLRGQLEKAVQQLQAALKNEQLDFYQSSRLQAKLKTLKSELEAEKAFQKK